MRGVGDEALVAGVTLIEARQRVVDRGHERHDLKRNLLHRQSCAALMDVDPPRLVRRRIQASEGAPHDHRRCDQRGGPHQEQAGERDAEQHERGREHRLGAGELSLCRGDDLDVAGVGFDALQPRRRLAWIVLEELPAEAGLTDLVEGAADSGEFGRHGAFAQRMPLPVADQQPEVGRLLTQLFQLGRRPQRQSALCVARERALHDFDNAIFVPLDQHEA